MRRGATQKSVLLFCTSLVFVSFVSWCEIQPSELDRLVKTIRLPEGFSISVFASGIEGARSFAIGDKCTIFVGTRDLGKVYALVDANKDGYAEGVYTIARNLASPNGVAFWNGSLYVAEIARIIRLDNIESTLANPGKPVVVYDKLPKDTAHGWKYIKFGPDGKLYVPVGAPCNACIPPLPVYASLHRMNADGTGFETFASGIRNTVGFDWNPITKELWFTDNGRDSLGDELPPDELNYAPEKGLNFGFPYVLGNGALDPDFGKLAKPDAYRKPAITLGPHVASLGMIFYTGSMFPPEYKGKIFIAEHGSWNRSVPIGYRVTLVTLDGNKAIRYDVFASGWLTKGSAWGRPVDVLNMPDGSILVSDDSAGAVYRISYKK
jgi:glucose/arabinose dehydrogenase